MFCRVGIRLSTIPAPGFMSLVIAKTGLLWLEIALREVFNIFAPPSDLANANLSGHLVAQLGVLSKLQYLELSNNSITGNIPEEIGGLSDLVSSDLYLATLQNCVSCMNPHPFVR
ncbi:hypothetical protein ACFX1Q_020921 [Malus domestica]